MKHPIVILVLLACASTAPALAQQVAFNAATITPADLKARIAFTSDAPSAPATVRELTAARFAALRLRVPISEVSLVGQLSAGLRSRDAATRGEALQDAIYYAANYGDLVDLTGLVPDLFRVFESDREASHRIMASQAICHLADMESVYDMARQAHRDPSPRVRHLALYAAASRVKAEQDR